MCGRQAESLDAGLLLEAMLTQLKLHDSWLEVMEDYAMVFEDCDDGRGASRMTSVRISYIICIHYMNFLSNILFFCNVQLKSSTAKGLHYRVKSTRTEVCNIVADVFRQELVQWEELPSGLGLGLSWNLLWSWGRPRINTAQMLVWQRVNHFEDSNQLTRKDYLKKNLQRFTGLGGKTASYFEIMPLTFILPHEYTSFVKAYYECSKCTQISNPLSSIDAISTGSGRNNDESSMIEAATAAAAKIAEYVNSCKPDVGNLWILKPVGLSRGRGISLVQDVSTVVYSQSSVIQKYVEKPLCLGGYKFDLRLYVLVTSFRPLEAFIYKEGFARISTQAYSLSEESLSNKFIHLTNSSIQKQNMKGPSSDNPLAFECDESGGSKLALLGTYGLWSRLKSFGIDSDQLWMRICLLVVKSLVAVNDRISYQPCSFEVFGYDVLVDSDLRPWLLEVNASPSLARETPLDVRVKNAMIKDTILLLDPAPYDRAAVVTVLKRRIKDVSKKKSPFLPRGDIELESDLRSILGNYVPRKYGDEPKHLGDYLRLCPNTKMYDSVIKKKQRIVKSV